MVSRTCTIVFTDLVGSTELRTQLGDDAFDAWRRTHDRLLSDSLGRHGGELIKHEGDGIMAVFASAADALSFAASVRQSLERERARQDAPFVLRIGISAGDVVEEAGDYHGTPVVEAARLCDVARGGQVLAADVVRVLAGSRGSHQLVPAGDFQLKGLTDPVVAWELPYTVADSAIEMPVRLREVAARGACVGRDSEINELVESWKRVGTGERRMVLVVGEPGIGKTRLAAELADRAVAHGGLALYGWCDEDLGTPYQPWVQAISSYFRGCSESDVEVLGGSGLAELARLVPEVAARVPDLASQPSADPETERARLFDAVDSFVERASAKQPLLFVLDDIHWADHPTLALLRRLLRSDRPGAILLLATFRDTDVDRRHPLAAVLADLRREPRASRVTIGGLDPGGIGELLADRAGHDAPPEFVEVLHEQTEGNPFFIEEVIAHLVETGAIYQRDGVWTSDLALDDLGLPEGVRDVVGRRLSLLPETANELLTVAAVVGREFDLTIVATASGAARDATLDALDVALHAGLIHEVPNSPGRFSFSHALVRQTLVEEIRGPMRARLHWRIGRALAESHDPPLATVAFHLCEGVLAGETREASQAAVVAAEYALSVTAAEEARSLAQRAIDLLDEAGSDEPELRCRGLLVLGETAAFASQDYQEARESVRMAADLAQRNGWPELACRAAMTYGSLFTPGVSDPTSEKLAVAALELGASSAWQPALQAIVAIVRIGNGDWNEASELIEEAVAGSDRGVPQGRMMALFSRAQAETGAPDLDRFASTTESLLAAAQATGSAYWIIGARLQRATLALRAGDRSGLEGEHRSLLELAANNVTNPSVQMLGNTFALLDGRFADAERVGLDVLAHTDPASSNYLNASAQIAAAWYWSGRDEELLGALDVFPVEQRPQRYLLDLVRASTLARRGERDAAFDSLASNEFAGLPWGWHRPGSLCHAASAAAWLGDQHCAEVLEPLLVPYAGQLLCTPVPALAYDSADSVRGMLLMTLGRIDEAIESFEAAADVCDRAADAPHGVMNAHRLAAALLARGRAGDSDRAYELATDSLELATTIGMHPDVHFARAVIEAGSAAGANPQ